MTVKRIERFDKRETLDQTKKLYDEYIAASGVPMFSRNRKLDFDIAMQWANNVDGNLDIFSEADLELLKKAVNINRGWRSLNQQVQEMLPAAQDAFKLRKK